MKRGSSQRRMTMKRAIGVGLLAMAVLAPTTVGQDASTVPGAEAATSLLVGSRSHRWTPPTHRSRCSSTRVTALVGQ